jgi:serine/threonine-protein phosphatase 6 regulatory ankyrin repeat subunit C
VACIYRVASAFPSGTENFAPRFTTHFIGCKGSKSSKLLDAIENGKVPEALRLIAEPDIDFTVQTRAGDCALGLACCFGHAQVAMAILAKQPPVDVNAANSQGWTSLMWASGEGLAEVVTVLLQRNANVSAVHSGGVSALGLAVYKGHESIALALIRAGADVNMNSGGTTPLMVCGEKMPAVKAALLAAGARV